MHFCNSLFNPLIDATWEQSSWRWCIQNLPPAHLRTPCVTTAILLHSTRFPWEFRGDSVQNCPPLQESREVVHIKDHTHLRSLHSWRGGPFFLRFFHWFERWTAVIVYGLSLAAGSSARVDDKRWERIGRTNMWQLSRTAVRYSTTSIYCVGRTVRNRDFPCYCIASYECSFIY